MLNSTKSIFLLTEIMILIVLSIIIFQFDLPLSHPVFWAAVIVQ